MLYNIIKNGPRGGRQVALAIHDDELNRFVKAFEKGKDTVVLNGETIYLQGADLVKIFDVSKKITPDSVTNVQKEIRKWANIMTKGIVDETVLSEYGEDLTSQYIKAGWGETPILLTKDEAFNRQASSKLFEKIQDTKTTIKNKRRYWAGGFGKFEGSNERLEKFKKDNYWQALDYDEDSNQSVAEAAWALFSEIKIGDWFLIKGYGGGQTMNIHYIGEVIKKDDKIRRVDFKRIRETTFSANQPKGKDAGNWFLTLLEVYREDIIQDLFFQHSDLKVNSDSKQDQKTSEIPKLENPSILFPENFSLREGKEGVIGVYDLARIMTNLIKKLDLNDKGKMIGIFGNWGRGKTFLFEKIWDELNTKTNPAFIKVEFHAWKYQDTPASWAYLYEAFSSEYFREDESKNKFFNEFNRLFKLLELNYYRVKQKVLVLVICLIIVYTGLVFWKQVNDTWRILCFFGAVPVISIGIIQALEISKKLFASSAKEIFKKFYTKVSFSSLLGVQAEIQKELKFLLKIWLSKKQKTKKILLFVDDIDRCSEDKIILIIDALRVLLEDEDISKQVVVLAAIDERVLKRAIKWKYHDLLLKDCDVDENERKILTRNIANEYMDKLFLSGIRLGTLTAQERMEVLNKNIGDRVDRGGDYGYGKEGVEADNNKKSEANQILDSKSFEKVQQPTITKTEKQIESNEEKDNKVVINPLRYDISILEEKQLSSLMEYSEDFTPRQIRIFYYRYLLARNILASKLGDHRPTMLHLETLARLLMHYSIIGDTVALKSKKTVLSKTSSLEAEMEILNYKQIFSTKDLILFHEVLEIVIAY